MRAISNERLEELRAMFSPSANKDVYLALGELLALRKERERAEPVAYIFKHPVGKLFWALTDESNKDHADVMPVYAAPPAPSHENVHYADAAEAEMLRYVSASLSWKRRRQRRLWLTRLQQSAHVWMSFLNRCMTLLKNAPSLQKTPVMLR
ncbi:hypothetical protein ROM12_02455 [Cronobacter sakazakii]|nr:hypothetical protein [Cronobacter sakazakii]MDT3617216.1 hypothetical protein [Cronobacter sakazakii]